MTTNLLAAELDSENMFRKIDDKIYKQLKNDRWDYVGKTFVRALWGDYKRAHDNVNPELSGTRIFAKSPDIKDYSEYLGAYIRDKKQTDKIFIEIKKSDKGTFFVKRGTIRIAFHPPVTVPEDHKENVPGLMEKVRSAILSGLAGDGKEGVY